MNLKIQKIILWPKNPSNKRREIAFKCRGVEVISGWSQKGKSALIQIVDYCLGSDKCAIPIGRVRDTVEWFGVLLALPDKRKILVGRRNPGLQPSSSEMFWETGTSIKLPNVPEKFVNRDKVIAHLNQEAQLPSHGPQEEEASSFDGPPSFRDMAAFNFQPQHIIANPYTLFFKAETMIHREKLIRSVFPYVLGAVDAATLANQAQLRRLESELRQKREQLDQQDRAAQMWKGQLQNFVSEMRLYGLIDESMETPDDSPVERLVGVLRTVPERWDREPQFREIDSVARQTRRQLSALQNEEKRLGREIEDSGRKLNKMSRLQNAATDYQSTLLIQEERIGPAAWLAHRIKEESNCPICGGPAGDSNTLQILADVAIQVSEASRAIRPADEALTTEIRRIEESIADKQKELTLIEARLKDWEQKSESLKGARTRRDRISMSIGRLRGVLETMEAASSSGPLRKEVDSLSKKVEELSRKVNAAAIRRRTDSALANISDLIYHYARSLGIEHSDQRWSLDDKNLTLSTVGGKKTDFLWEIGSAANWMGYHVATLLALHEHFRKVGHNPVPKFLMIDQPSQAFFPEGMMAARKAKGEKRVSDDLERLQRLFKTLSDAVTRTKGGLQIILLEHAEPETWKGIPNFSMPDGQWRDDNALIPLDWT
ncbi:MAG: DUF3732 domain-containing protein [Verrucomicrobiales bacterium]|nr:DUF3732 domain-containing protein [Verrucomicrobiales bacterium]